MKINFFGGAGAQVSLHQRSSAPCSLGKGCQEQPGDRLRETHHLVGKDFICLLQNSNLCHHHHRGPEYRIKTGSCLADPFKVSPCLCLPGEQKGFHPSTASNSLSPRSFPEDFTGCVNKGLTTSAYQEVHSAVFHQGLSLV